MRRVGVELAINEQTVCILARGLDNEDDWDEMTSSEFRSNILKDLTVEIVNTFYDRGELTYVYTVKDAGSLQACFLDLETGVHLCDYTPLQKLLSMGSIDDIKVIQKEDDNITLSILNEVIMISETKLISFTNKKSIIQIIM